MTENETTMYNITCWKRGFAAWTWRVTRHEIERPPGGVSHPVQRYVDSRASSFTKATALWGARRAARRDARRIRQNRDQADGGTRVTETLVIGHD